LDYGAILTPYLAVDLDVLKRNIDRMQEFVAGAGVSVRPHVKTHKCPEIARLQVESGAIGVTCAKLGEAEVMVQRGIKDILIANQVVGTAKLVRLAEIGKVADVKVGADDETHVRAISDAASFMSSEVGIVIEVDVGMGRCGVRTKEGALTLARLIKALPGIRFSGLLGYEGHTVLATPRSTRLQNCTEANAKLVGVARHLEDNGIDVEIVSGGGTGTYDMTGVYQGITEIEAGSYVFMDACYGKLGLPFEQSLFIVCTVVSTPEDGVCVVDGGLKTMTSEFGYPVPAFLMKAGGGENKAPIRLSSEVVQVKILSEEHAILDTGTLEVSVGDKVFMIPSHICTTVNLHNQYQVFQSGRFVTRWDIEARGASY
jgi:D-serine deaminase-like pyridoxal phosphate-dependent protein